MPIAVPTIPQENRPCRRRPEGKEEVLRASIFTVMDIGETKKLFHREYHRKLPRDMQKVAMRKIWMIDAAPDLNSLRVPPGNSLEALSGHRLGQHSIRINDKWRICFRWHDGNAYDVEIVDYH